ncbi:hypothetical protein FHW96_000879 [Novosphingobium sp. SG751A]|uniref:DUF4286 family protein n=1 Tax=Novosphingobium sp. SG751A TaxID=2587000 RepID=UPI0015536847|nr:DUF4286 family protein [Novosphingobium sp. SG751A]NOW44737.1 hypothetical protein [Novosphingobium sp. SG751A]
MSLASFIRWPLIAGASDEAARALIGAHDGWALRSMIDAEEACLYCPPETGAPARGPTGAAHYELDLASDTGPVNRPWGVIMLVAFDVPDAMTAQVERWYDDEHIELLMRAPGWLRARRYRVRSHTGGPRWTSMAFHELADISVMDSPERAFARSTPWRAELEKGAWFQGAGRGVFRPLGC